MVGGVTPKFQQQLRPCKHLLNNPWARQNYRLAQFRAGLLTIKHQSHFGVLNTVMAFCVMTFRRNGIRRNDIRSSDDQAKLQAVSYLIELQPIQSCKMHLSPSRLLALYQDPGRFHQHNSTNAFSTSTIPLMPFPLIKSRKQVVISTTLQLIYSTNLIPQMPLPITKSHKQLVITDQY